MVKGPKQGFVPEHWMKHFKFAFVRNPYDRAISAWRMFEGGMENSVWKHPEDHRGISFKRFLEIATNETISFDGLRKTTEEKIRHHAIPQTHDFNCLKFADFVGRFENLENDFKVVAEEIGLELDKFPHWNQTRRDSDYMSYYDAETKATVEEFYKVDFEKLEYPVVR